MIKHLTASLILIAAFWPESRAQSDWHTYPVRSIAEIIRAHAGEEASSKADLIVSADPFPSKTVATYTGRRRGVGGRGKYFIGLWAQTKNIPPENAGMLVEEYLFREQGTEHWMPVIRTLTPFFDKELKEGDEVEIYYFFLGGYNEKKLGEKDSRKRKGEANAESLEAVKDGVTWVFAVEEFRK